MKVVLIKNLENGLDVKWLAVQLCSKMQILREKKKKGKKCSKRFAPCGIHTEIFSNARKYLFLENNRSVVGDQKSFIFCATCL